MTVHDSSLHVPCGMCYAESGRRCVQVWRPELPAKRPHADRLKLAGVHWDENWSIEFGATGTFDFVKRVRGGVVERVGPFFVKQVAEEMKRQKQELEQAKAEDTEQTGVKCNE